MPRMTEKGEAKETALPQCGETITSGSGRPCSQPGHRPPGSLQIGQAIKWGEADRAWLQERSLVWQLRCPGPIWEGLGPAPDASFRLTQTCEAAGDGVHGSVPAPHTETWTEFQAPGSGLVQPLPSRAFGGENRRLRALSACFCLSLCYLSALWTWVDRLPLSVPTPLYRRVRSRMRLQRATAEMRLRSTDVSTSQAQTLFPVPLSSSLAYGKAPAKGRRPGC